jgi:dipeptidyl aminopeptidase/acylaminoacyl peptidase
MSPLGLSPVVFSAVLGALAARGDEADGGPLPEGAVARVEAATACLAFSPDGRALATADGKAFCLWDAATGRRRLRVEPPLGASWIAFSPDGRLLASAPRIGELARELSLWGPATGRRLRDLTPSDGCPCPRVAFSGDGKSLLTATMRARVVTFDVATGRQGPHRFQSRPDPFVSGTGFYLPFVLAPDGRTVAVPRVSNGRPADIQLWDAETGREGVRLAVEGAPLAFSPDGALVAVAAGDEGLSLVEARSGAEVRRCEAVGRRVWCAAFAPDGWELAVGADGSNDVQLWEVTTGRLRRTLTGHKAPVKALAFAPDGRLASAGKGTVLIWGLPPPPPAEPLTREALAAVWHDLADVDAARAWRATERLRADPERAVTALGERLRPAVAADTPRIARLVADLGSADFKTREKARAALRERGDDAFEPLWRAAAGGTADLEARRRAAELYAEVRRRPVEAGERRALRAVEALERIGSPAAREMLRRLAGGADGARLRVCSIKHGFIERGHEPQSLSQ